MRSFEEFNWEFQNMRWGHLTYRVWQGLDLKWGHLKNADEFKKIYNETPIILEF